ncbi:hypothetical protein YTPLAS18_19460 [Nitrospira sp.]|nr:hypothetical protein YTPLAS18_19460 [Nitrospira sp.]
MLEGRRIGARTYPTWFVVVYDDHALRRPGYRFFWMTVSDEAILAAQSASIERKRQEQGETETETTPSFMKRKGEKDTQKFVQKPSDLEKQLAFSEKRARRDFRRLGTAES